MRNVKTKPINEKGICRFAFFLHPNYISQILCSFLVDKEIKNNFLCEYKTKQYLIQSS